MAARIREHIRKPLLWGPFFVATKVISIHNIDSSNFAASNSDSIDAASRKCDRIQQSDTRGREILVSSVEPCVADGHEEVLLCDISSDRGHTKVCDGLAQGGDGNFSGMGRSCGVI
jgi:hypothetical protein